MTSKTTSPLSLRQAEDEYRVRRTTAPASVKVGDVFYASWGYDQTNITFFVVVGLTPSGKSVRIRECGSKCVQDSGPYEYVVADPKHMTGPVLTKRLRTGYQGRPSLYWRDYADLYLWDGTPKYQTGWGYGH